MCNTAQKSLRTYVIKMVGDDKIVPMARFASVRNQAGVIDVLTELGYHLSSLGHRAVYVKQGYKLTKHHCGTEKVGGMKNEF